MDKKLISNTILGLDLGSNSIGWALIEVNSDKQNSIIASGSKVFEAGLGDLETKGKGVSRNMVRREARGRRRLLDRHKRRIIKLANLLMRAGFLPECNYNDSLERHNKLQELDKQFGDPYSLRARALDEKLPAYELGRAIYHLAQRRGFKSNRKSTPKKNEEYGIVKKHISELQKSITESGSRSLGEYFSKLDTSLQKIRSQYTSRQMYEDEFNLIWSMQSTFYDDKMTDEFKKEISDTIFFQRPLKSQSRFIGECELEPDQKRAPWLYLKAQEFRYLQTVNNMIIIDTNTGEERELSEEQREALIQKLEVSSKLKFPEIRMMKEFGKNIKFNLESDGRKDIPGNSVIGSVIKTIGMDKWEKLTKEEQADLLEDFRSIEKEEVLKKKAINKYKLDEKTAEKFANSNLEPGYCNFSRKAIRKLIPKLQAGISLQTIIKEVYPEQFEKKGDALDFLPMVKDKELPDLRNPIVERTLTELRKVVNAIIRDYGKPDLIRIELARDLKQSGKQREDTIKRNRDNESSRKKAAALVIRETGIEYPSRDDILKAQLWEECRGTCPYSGKTISSSSLFGSHSEFDIEHIIPFSRSLDDSFLNKTLCHAHENRNIKKNKTPFEAYGHTDKWDDIISRVIKFKGNTARAKLRRFEMSNEDIQKLMDNFTSRQLNDTRWAAKSAKKYLGLLYGGINDDGIDAQGNRRVQAISSGRVTAFLRNSWGLNAILGDGGLKSRDDHRHHAVDAIVIALTSPEAVKTLSKLAGLGYYTGRQRFDNMPLPWEGFVQDVREIIDKIIVSHRVSNRVRGALHKESFYGKPRFDEKGKEYIHIRKPISSLSNKDVDNIVDPVIRNTVKAKLDELGQTPDKAFAEECNYPTWNNGIGEILPIKKVRIRQNFTTYPVGSTPHQRNVKSESNHHMALYEITNEDGKVVKWEGEVVSMFEAHQRKLKKQPIINRINEPGKRFLFSLATGDIIEIESVEGNRILCVVRTVPQSKQIRFVSVNDARILKNIPKTGYTAMPGSLKDKNCLKKVITPLGEVRDARD